METGIRNLSRDLRHAWRSAAGAPGFTALAALTLALGIGAATIVFALTDAVLLHPFPFAQPERLVAVWGESPDAGHARVEVSVRDAEDWRAGNRVFSAAPWPSATGPGARPWASGSTGPARNRTGPGSPSSESPAMPAT